ncbi:unnamed protein product [Cuscuta epithymum]|uniref:Transposase MuDR plant domain-containing protein n=1 Tax=Cuscuta epithymum TaxID=186058 RepID=A0AAV0DYY2_9ASTE|nr:unnamed protein product [Cuscuta epithymum]
MLVWKVGMKFASPEIFKKQVVRYAIIAGYSIRFSKSEKVKIAARCKEGCVWRIYASWDGLKESFVVKSLNPNHTCNRQDYENIHAKPSWSISVLQISVSCVFVKVNVGSFFANYCYIFLHQCRPVLGVFCLSV